MSEKKNDSAWSEFTDGLDDAMKVVEKKESATCIIRRVDPPQFQENNSDEIEGMIIAFGIELTLLISSFVAFSDGAIGGGIICLILFLIIPTILIKEKITIRSKLNEEIELSKLSKYTGQDAKYVYIKNKTFHMHDCPEIDKVIHERIPLGRAIDKDYQSCSICWYQFIKK